MIKKISYLLIITSLIGSNNIDLHVGEYQLSLFRLMLLLAIISMMVDLTRNRSSIYIIRNASTYSIMVMLLWFTYAIISVIWVKDYGSWIRAIYLLGIGVFSMLLFIRSFNTTKDFLSVFNIISIMSILHNFIGWREVLTGTYWFLDPLNIPKYQSYRAAVSIFVNMNNFALFLCIAACSLLICIRNERFFTLKVIYSITLISTIILLINHTYSRGNILGFGLGTAFILFYYLNPKTRMMVQNYIRRYFKTILRVPGNQNRHKKQIIINTTVITIIIAIVIYLFIININNMLIAENYSNSARINLIKNGMIFLFNTYGMGTGAGNVEYWMSNFAVFNTDGLVNMHNWWVEILVSYGIIIFIFYLILYYKIFASLWKNYHTSHENTHRVISLSLMGFMLAFIIGSISPSSVFVLEWFWIFWGVLIAYQRNITTDQINTHMNKKMRANSVR